VTSTTGGGDIMYTLTMGTKKRNFDFKLGVIGLLGADSNTSFNLPSYDLDQAPETAIIISSNARNAGAGRPDWFMTFGATDGSVHGAISANSDYGVGTTVADRRAFSDAVSVLDLNGGNLDKLTFNSFIDSPYGVKLNVTNTNSNDNATMAIMPAGSDILASEVLIQNLTGFAVGVESNITFANSENYNMFVFQFCGSAVSEGQQNGARASFGMLTYTNGVIIQKCSNIRVDRNNVGAAQPAHILHTNRAFGVIGTSSDIVPYDGEITSVGTGVIGLTMRDGTSNDDLIITAYKINTANVKMSLIEFDMPTSLGVWSMTDVGFRVSGFIAVCTMLTAWDSLATDMSAGSLCLMASNPTDESHVINWFNEDAAGTTNCRSTWWRRPFMYSYGDGTVGGSGATSGFSVSINDEIVPTATGFDLDMGGVNSTVRKSFGLFFGDGSSETLNKRLRDLRGNLTGNVKGGFQ